MVCCFTLLFVRGILHGKSMGIGIIEGAIINLMFKHYKASRKWLFQRTKKQNTLRIKTLIHKDTQEHENTNVKTEYANLM